MKHFFKVMTLLALLNFVIAPMATAASGKVDTQSIEELLKKKKRK